VKITLFGATGRTGQTVIEQALAAGHGITAFARTPAKLAARPGLRIVQGEITDAAKVAEAIAGAEAVISVLGAARGGASIQLTLAAKNIIAGMQAHGVKRLIYSRYAPG